MPRVQGWLLVCYLHAPLCKRGGFCGWLRVSSPFPNYLSAPTRARRQWFSWEHRLGCAGGLEGQPPPRSGLSFLLCRLKY